MRNKKELLEYYTDKMTGLDEVLQSRKAKVKYIITAEILLFVVAVAVAVVYLCGYVSVAVFIPAFCIALASFVGVKVFDRQNSVAIDRMEARIDVYRHSHFPHFTLQTELRFTFQVQQALRLRA